MDISLELEEVDMDEQAVGDTCRDYSDHCFQQLVSHQPTQRLLCMRESLKTNLLSKNIDVVAVIPNVPKVEEFPFVL